MKGKIGKCCVCGEYGELTREHIPPRKAFNEEDVLLKRIDQEKPRATIKWKEQRIQGGYSEHLLCSNCNNNTGSWYSNEYKNFVKICADYASPLLINLKITLSINNIALQKVLKQVLVIMCASCGPWLAEANQELRKLILDKYSQGLPEHLRLFAYLRSHEGMRSTGQTEIYNVYTRKSRIVAEFSCWPVGWILAFYDNDEFIATEVTHWSKFGFKEKISTYIQMPCLYTGTFYPTDFRTTDEIKRDRQKNIEYKKEALKKIESFSRR